MGKTSKSKTAKTAVVKKHLNLTLDQKIISKLRKNAEKRDMTPTQYVSYFVNRDANDLAFSEEGAIRSQLYTIDNWQRKIFYTVDSFAKLFHYYIFESFKYMSDYRGTKKEDYAIHHALDKMGNFLSEFRARKNNYNNSFLEQMFKVIIETSADFKKLNPLNKPEIEAEVIKKRYESIIQDQTKALYHIFTTDELDFISISCCKIDWSKITDIKQQLLTALEDVSEIEEMQMGINLEELKKKVPNCRIGVLYALIEYIENYCDMNYLTPIEKSELFAE